MLVPMFLSIYYEEAQWPAFLSAAFLALLCGGLMVFFSRSNEEIRHGEGFVIVALGWLLASIFGSLPYLFTGTVNSFSDAFFETVSGFTTTGASVLTNIEAVTKGMLFWRSLTHWLGGMGIIVLFVAVLSLFGNEAMQMFKAEVPGPVPEKIKPRIRETAKILWLTYLSLTGAQFLLLLIAGMDPFDAINHTFATLATGGFSTKNASVGAFDSPLIHWVIIIFMYLAGVNFTLYYQALRGKNLKFFWRNEEFVLYSAIIAIAIVAISINFFKAGLEYDFTAIVFQVVSIITTTGFATVDFEIWPVFPQVVLLTLIFVGGCSSSTAGSVKVGRYLILFKQVSSELRHLIHPRAVSSLKVNQKSLSADYIFNVYQYFFLYMTIVVLSTLVLTFSGTDLVTSFSAVATTLGNVGPGLGSIGPADNYAHFSGGIKIFFSFLMLLGRLEIYTLLILLFPSTWRK
ncbi:MAG TPA: TrkH family potassium uptake protein [Clostridia bacterium]|nr:TrkH family potassium uptake protein [Clostridia bacterium]